MTITEFGCAVEKQVFFNTLGLLVLSLSNTLIESNICGLSTQPLSPSPLDFTQLKARHYAKQNALSLGSVTGHIIPNASLSLASVTGANFMGVEESGREDMPVSVTDSDQNHSLVRTVPHPPQLSFSSYILLFNHKTHNHCCLATFAASCYERSVGTQE